MHLSELKNKFKYRLLPKIMDKLTFWSTHKSRKILDEKNIKSILIDNTILFHSVTHETAWISAGKKTWGDTEIDTGGLARIPVHHENDKSREYKSIQFLPSLISLAKNNYITLCLSDELKDEQLTQPSGRFKGYGMFDHSLFKGVKFEHFKDADYKVTIAPLYSGFASAEQQRKARLLAKKDELYHSLLKVLGGKNSQDVWHIVTAERNGCYCFLTMDFRLVNNIKAQSKNKIVRSINTKVLTPEELGIELEFIPTPTRYFSYHNASFPVRDDLNWNDSKRQKPNRNRI